MDGSANAKYAIDAHAFATCEDTWRAKGAYLPPQGFGTAVRFSNDEGDWFLKTGSFIPENAEFETRVRSSFERQQFMMTLGAELGRVEPGLVEIRLPITPALAQQHGFVHAGAVASIADSACGYAALTLMGLDSGVLAVEFKINLMAPAAGEFLIARGRVLRAGRTLSVCQAEVSAVTGGVEKDVALLVATIMNVRGRADVSG
ncbi:MAG: PaaI family thioesterase [Gemmatimonadaceae bacterium]